MDLKLLMNIPGQLGANIYFESKVYMSCTYDSTQIQVYLTSRCRLKTEKESRIRKWAADVKRGILEDDTWEHWIVLWKEVSDVLPWKW